MYNKEMIERIRFFKEHGASIAGKAMLSAAYYAKAELFGQELDLEVKWEPDQYSTVEDLIDTVAFPEAIKKFESGEWEAWGAFITDEAGDCLASLGGIILNGNDNPYRRVVEAELMAEAIETLKKGA